MEKKGNKHGLTLKNLTKSTVWDIQESDVFRLWEIADKDTDMRENTRKYIDILRTAFLVEQIADDITLLKGKYERMGYKVGQMMIDGQKTNWAVKKRPILRVSDLTYENIGHISAPKLVEVLGRNFGGGWDSLPQSIQDIIESGFDISTTTLPSNRLKKPGGMYEKKVEDGFEVLEVPKGTWTEAIFVKKKPQTEKLRMQIEGNGDDDSDMMGDGLEESRIRPITQEYSDDEINEDNYRTTFEVEDVAEEEGEEMADFSTKSDY